MRRSCACSNCNSDLNERHALSFEATHDRLILRGTLENLFMSTGSAANWGTAELDSWTTPAHHPTCLSQQFSVSNKQQHLPLSVSEQVVMNRPFTTCP